MMEFKFRWQTRKRLSKITVGFVEDDELQPQFAAFRSRYSRPRVLSGLCLLANGRLSITITILPFPVAEKVLVKRTNLGYILRYSRLLVTVIQEGKQIHISVGYVTVVDCCQRWW